jgi:hypothetical protein
MARLPMIDRYVVDDAGRKATTSSPPWRDPAANNGIAQGR